MRASEFARRVARIESARATRKRGARFRAKALRQLAKRAGAALIVPNGKVIGWRLPDGSVACGKYRYRTGSAAVDELLRIHRHAARAYIPVRTYRCEWCDGYHLTSRA